MNCEELRLHIGAAPHALPPEAADHVAGCAQCRGLLDDALAFEKRLTRALDTLPPAVPAAQRGAKAASSRGRQPNGVRWLLAASVLFAALGVVLWSGRTSSALAADVLEHLAEEPMSWSQTQRMPQSAVDLVFSRTRLRIDTDAVNVVYSNSCWFREHYVPHLVVTTPNGPVTVLVLEAERVSGASEFRDGNYRGRLVPVHDGAIAVIGRTANAVTDEVVQQVTRALRAEAPTTAITSVPAG